MTIVSSTILSDVPQRDSRRYIVERHVDQHGITHDHPLSLMTADYDAQAGLAQHAADLDARLRSDEIASNVAQATSVYPYTLTFLYSTLSDTLAAVREAYAVAVEIPATLTGAFLADQSDADLAAAFGYANPSADLSALRSKINAQRTLRASGLQQTGL